MYFLKKYYKDLCCCQLAHQMDIVYYGEWEQSNSLESEIFICLFPIHKEHLNISCPDIICVIYFSKGPVEIIFLLKEKNNHLKQCLA